MPIGIPDGVPNRCPSCGYDGSIPNGTYAWYHHHLQCKKCHKDPRLLTKDGVRLLISHLEWGEPSHKTTGPAIKVCKDWLRLYERSG